MWLQRATLAAFYGKLQGERELVKGDAARLIAEAQDSYGDIQDSWEERVRLPNGVECCWYPLTPILHLPSRR